MNVCQLRSVSSSSDTATSLDRQSSCLRLRWSRPQYPLGREDLNIAFDAAGIVLVLLGQLLRIVTIGYEYIVRGGRNRQVYADDLVQGGMFALSRNPLYFGNVLIAVGLALVINAYAFYLIVIPLTVSWLTAPSLRPKRHTCARSSARNTRTIAVESIDGGRG